MRENWITDHVGPEVQPRAAFEGELATTLESAWQGVRPTKVTSLARQRRRPTRVFAIVGWAAAAIALVIGVAVVVRNDDDGAQAPANTGDTTVDTSPDTVPVTTGNTIAAPVTTVTVPTTDPLPPATASTPEEQTVLDYLTALEGGRYDDAAMLLGQGGLELEGRRDIRPLFDAAGTLANLGEALRIWCESGAICQTPISIATDSGRVIAGFSVGGAVRDVVFVGGTFEGAPSVQGLPLRLPAGESLADTVACATTSVGSTMLADLDGDGWAEIITTQNDPALLSVCGTRLTVPALPIDAQRGVATIDTDSDGTDELFVMDFSEDGFTGAVWQLSGGVLVDTGLAGSLSNPANGQPGTSFGCRDLNDDGITEWVTYTYQYVGGSELSNSTALVVEQNSFGSTQQITLELPGQIEEAFGIIGGFCAEFQVQTG